MVDTYGTKKLKLTVSNQTLNMCRVLVGITGVMKSTPTKTLETLLSILPLDLYLEQEAMTTAVRLRNIQCWNALG